MKELSKKVKITVCADGFVSIMEKPSDKRQRAALPVHSTDTIEQAFILIQEVCTLGRCSWGGKTGTLIEPKAPNWPRGEGSIEDLDELSRAFQEAEASMCF